MDKGAVSKSKEYLCLAAVITGVYIGFKYLSPLITPFLFAFALVVLLYPFLERLQKRLHIKKSFLAAGILILVCAVAGIILWGLFSFIFREMGDIFSRMDVFEEKFLVFVSGCCDGIEKRFGVNGDGIESYIIERVNILIENFQVQVVPKMMNESIEYVKNVVNVVSFFGIMFIAAVLLAKDYGAIMQKLYSHRETECVMQIGFRIFSHVGTFIKAQLIILLIISSICTAGLWVAGIEGGVVLGIFTGFMDMLPFIGTGLVLMPLAFWQILNGYYAKAVICVVLYIICILTREFLEPKLIGEKMGIFPIVILFSVYAGVKLFGIFGIIKGPLALITIYEVYRSIRKTSKEKVMQD